MGKVFSLASSKINRVVSNFNVENRAHKIISQDKPVPAPKHPTTIREIDNMIKEHGEKLEILKKKDPTLDKNLRQVFVKSFDPQDGKSSQETLAESRKKLPVNRTTPVVSELGYDEPEIVPKGRVTIKQAMTILAEHQEDPLAINPAYVSSHYDLHIKHAEYLLKYFRSFNVYIPEKKQLKDSGGASKFLGKK